MKKSHKPVEKLTVQCRKIGAKEYFDCYRLGDNTNQGGYLEYGTDILERVLTLFDTVC